MVAAGSYLRALREARHLSRAQVAAEAGTNEAQIVRIEKGEIDTRSSLLLRFAHYVRASADQLMQLVVNEDATAEDGQDLADVWLSHVAEYDDRDVLAVIREMRAELDRLEDRVDRPRVIGGVEPAT